MIAFRILHSYCVRWRRKWQPIQYSCWKVSWTEEHTAKQLSALCQNMCSQKFSMKPKSQICISVCHLPISITANSQSQINHGEQIPIMRQDINHLSPAYHGRLQKEVFIIAKTPLPIWQFIEEVRNLSRWFRKQTSILFFSKRQSLSFPPRILDVSSLKQLFSGS